MSEAESEGFRSQSSLCVHKTRYDWKDQISDIDKDFDIKQKVHHSFMFEQRVLKLLSQSSFKKIFIFEYIRSQRNSVFRFLRTQYVRNTFIEFLQN